MRCRFRSFALALFVYSFHLHAAFGYEVDGVLVSRSDPGYAQLESAIQDYTQKVVVNAVIQNVNNNFTRLVNTAKVNILPHIGQEAMYQMVQQIFIQEETKQFTSDLFETAYKQALNNYKDTIPQDQIQSAIHTYIDTEMIKISEKPVYQRMLKEIIDFAYVQSQKFLIMNVAQQQMRMKEIQMKYLAMQQMAMEQYQKALQINAMRAQQQQNAAQQQYQDAYSEAYQQQLYEQQLRYQQMEEYCRTHDCQ